MELVIYLLKRLSRYVMIIFVMILPLIVGTIIPTMMNIKEASFILIILGYIVLFFIQHFIDAWKYMKANNASPEEAWKMTFRSQSDDEF